MLSTRAGRRSRCERLAEVIGRDGACSKALKAGTYRFKDLCRLLGGKRHAWRLCRFAINKKAMASVGQMMSM
jgi:hypothetical protein